MKDLINQWFEQSSPFQGILACGLRHADHSTVTKTWSNDYPDVALENALRCVSDLFQVLQLNRLPPGRVRWIYQNVFLYCERRSDGTCLAAFIPRDPQALDVEGLERMFSEFRTLTSTS